MNAEMPKKSSSPSLTESFIRICNKCWKAAGEGKMLVAASGGADSTALLLALHLAGIPIFVVHCNFNLRGAESLRDRDFVMDLCREKNLPFAVIDFDTRNEMQPGESLEMTCRRLRYAAFDEILKKESCNRIVLAHNADDNIETFLMNALRGSGVFGLKAMKEDDGKLLRPLLNFHRKEILKFLEENEQEFVTDSSNFESEFRRNFLRNEIIPLLETRWPGARKALKKTISILNREAEILNHSLGAILNDNSGFLDWEAIDNYPEPQTLIFRFIHNYGGSPDIASEITRSLKNKRSGKQWMLKNGFKAVFKHNGIEIRNSEIVADSENVFSNFSWENIKAEDVKKEDIKCSDNNSAFLPYPPERYEFRCASKEMKIKSLGMKGSQNVMKVLKDARISAEERLKTKVLVDRETEDVIWIPGIKRSSLHLITGEENEIYIIKKT